MLSFIIVQWPRSKTQLEITQKVLIGNSQIHIQKPKTDDLAIIVQL